MPQNKYFNVSWEMFHRDTRALSAKLKDQQNWHGLIAVTRGGLVPAAILSQELDLRLIDTVCISSYGDDETASSMQILKSLQQDGKGLIVIDDLVDSGRTFLKIREMLPNAYYAAVYAKPEGEHRVDCFCKSVAQDKWIVFPWEQQIQQDLETI